MNNLFSEGSSLRKGFARALIAASVIVAAGCDLSTGEVESGINQFTHVRNPVGNLIGIVVDSNSRPIAGATVSINGNSVTTNAQGTYSFLNIPVTNVSTSGDDDSTDHSSIRVVVSPPDGTDYCMGAIVHVYPEAQLHDVQSGQPFDSDDGDQAQSNAGSQAVFFDGFNIQVEDAVLPECTARVDILAVRDAWTGNAVVNTPASLDFVDIDKTGGSDENLGSNSSIQYPTVSWTSTTSSTGAISFLNLAANSEFRVHFAGYACNPDANPDFDDNDLDDLDDADDPDNDNTPDTCYALTKNETQPVTYENLWLTRLQDAGDFIAPTIMSVTGVKAEMGPGLWGCSEGGLLNRGIDGTAGLRFNATESIMPNASLAGSVVVYDWTGETYVNVGTPTVSGSSITAATTAAIAEGHEFSAFLFSFDFMDLAGNALNTNDKSADYVCMGDAQWAKFLEVALHTYRDPQTNPDMPADGQQEQIDPILSGAQNDGSALQERSVSFNDVADGDAAGITTGFADDNGIEQLQLDPFEDTQDALELLSRGFFSSIEVRTRGTRVTYLPDDTFTAINVYVNGLLEASLDSDDFDTNSYTRSPCTTTGGACDIYSVHELASGRNALVIGGASLGLAPDDIVTLRYVDDFGIQGMPKSVTLVDNVEPTVGLQRSYQNWHDYDFFNENTDVCVQGEGGCVGTLVSGCSVHDPDNDDGEAHAGVITDAGVGSFGDGGELSAGGVAAEIGDVCIGIGPELLINPDADAETAHTELEAGRDSDYDDNVGDPFAFDYLERAYDEQAWNNWTRPDDIRVGVSFVENLAEGLNGSPTYGGSAGLSGFLVQNDTAAGHLTSPPLVADLVTMIVDDVLSMANDDHGAVLNFAGVVSDVSGNPATLAARPIVVVRDQWPPYITEAYRDDDGSLVFVFNEPVVIDELSGDEEFEFTDGQGTGAFFGLDLNAQPFTQSVDGMTITIDSADVPPGFSTVFGNAGLVYTDSFGTDVPHALLDWRNISDEKGNSWATHRYFHTGGLGLFDTDDHPIFLFQDRLGPFAFSSPNSATFIDTATRFEDTVTATHPVANWFVASVGPNGVCEGGGGDDVAPIFPGIATGDDADCVLEAADFVGGTDDCSVTGSGSVECDDDFIEVFFPMITAAGTCDNTANGTAGETVTPGTLAAATDSFLTISADQRSLRLVYICDAGAVATGDVLGITGGGGTAASSFTDENIAAPDDNDFDVAE